MHFQRRAMSSEGIKRIMNKEKSERNGSIPAIIILVVAGCVGGGYFIFSSAVIGIVLTLLFIGEILKDGKYCFAGDMNMLSLTVMAGMYLGTAIWAIDQGMAVMGFVKFFPVLLWAVYICGHLELKEKLIQTLPYLGSLMTLFSILMMQFKVFKSWVTVAGRLAGFFQYPNTYAVFMLVCFLVAIWNFERDNIDYWNIFHIVMAVTGIVLSGSRTVYVLFALTAVFLVIRKKEFRKLAVIAVGAGVIIILINLLTGNGNIVQRIMTISTSESTLLGRLLYWKDAGKLIVKHPFGMGYYGYYYLEQEIQTGVYSVANVHNELIQLILDIGIVPAVIVFGNLIRCILKCERGSRDQIILILLLLHSLFDYDFQFMIIWMVMVLFLDFHNLKEVKIPVLTRVVIVLTGIGVVILSCMVGSSDIMYIQGNSKQALKLYSGNMQARINQLSEAKDASEMKKSAENILKRNEHIAVAYSALASAAFSDGDTNSFIKYKLTAIELAPYQYDEYTDYLNTLLYCADQYLTDDDLQSARTCVLRAAQIPELLDKVDKKTSDISWKIKDTPQVTLSHKNLALIEEYKEKVNQE